MKNYCYTCMNELTDDSFCRHCMKQNTADDIVYRLMPGTILNHKYLVGNCIGEGGFGITYIGRDLTLDMRVAIKEYFPNGYVNRNNTLSQDVTATTEGRKAFFAKGKDSFLEEARKIAKFVGEPGIVGVREYFEANGTAYIIMDYLDGVNLSSYIKSQGAFNAVTMFELMLPMVRSLKHIHDAGIIHRDISPDNIMFLHSGGLKLMDFGAARYFTNEQKEMSVLLKQGYAPEEQYRKNGDQGPWTDVYGLCATMYRCITGTIPVDALDRLRNDSLLPPSKLGITIPESMENVLMYGLAVFKENRCQSMDELAELMEKALKREKLNIPQPQNAYADLHKTQSADEYYKTRTQQQFTGSTVTQPRYPEPIPPHSGEREYAPTASRQGPNKKAVIAIIITSAVIILATVGLMFYLLGSHGGKENADNTNASSSSAAEETVQKTVKVPNCVGKSLEYSKTALEGVGLSAETEYEYSSDVAKGDVIKQSEKADSEVDTGSTITLTVSKGAEASPYEYSQKLTVSASRGSSYATATLYEWKDGKWSETAEYDARVGANGIGTASEGSRTSPAGTHKLGIVLAKGDVSTEMKTYQVTPQTGVISDTNSSYYNQIFERSNAPTLSNFDVIYDEFSNAAIFIEFNGDGFSQTDVVRGGGSAICVRGKSGGLTSTYGDVDIASGDMSDLLSKLDPDKKPVIELTVD